MVADHAVAGEARIVDQHDVVSNLAVVRDVRADHEQAVIPDFSQEVRLFRSGIDRDIFPQHAALADGQLPGAARLAFQLSRLADRGKGKISVLAPIRVSPVRITILVQANAVAEHDGRADLAECADDDIGADRAVDLGRAMNDCQCGACFLQRGAWRAARRRGQAPAPSSTACDRKGRGGTSANARTVMNQKMTQAHAKVQSTMPNSKARNFWKSGLQQEPRDVGADGGATRC